MFFEKRGVDNFDRGFKLVKYFELKSAAKTGLTAETSVFAESFGKIKKRGSEGKDPSR